MDTISSETMKITELQPGSIISLTARRGNRSYRFESFILGLTEQADIEFVSNIVGEFVLVEPIRVDEKLVRFTAEGINYYFIGNHKDKPYLFKNISIEKVRLPLYGVAHLLRAPKEGMRFNRRGHFRVWLGQHCNIALRDSKAQHDAIIKDVSTSGAGLIIKKDYEVHVGDSIEVQFNTEKYNEQREDYQFTVYTFKAEITRVVEHGEKVNLVGSRMIKGQENIEKFVAIKQRAKNRVGRKTTDLISMFVGKPNEEEE